MFNSISEFVRDTHTHTKKEDIRIMKILNLNFS
jgi:hypothetical protein